MKTEGTYWGSIAFDQPPDQVVAAIRKLPGMAGVELLHSGPCTEYPGLTRYKVADQSMQMAAGQIDAIVKALSHSFAMHRCIG